jgi:hypothetical protein
VALNGNFQRRAIANAERTIRFKIQKKKKKKRRKRKRKGRGGVQNSLQVEG